MNGKGSDRRPQLVSDRLVRFRWWLTFKAPRWVKAIARLIRL